MNTLYNISALIPLVHAAEGGIPIAEQIGNFYAWAVSISAFVALGIFVYAGLAYIASGGNASRQEDAKQWIWGALIGLGLLFGSYIILNTINPDLTHLRDPSLLFTQGGEVEQGSSRVSRGLTEASKQCPSGVRKNCSQKYVEFAKLARSYATPSPGISACAYPSNLKLREYVNAVPPGRIGSVYGADCGTYVGVVMRQTIDPDWPEGYTPAIASYVESGEGRKKFDFIHMIDSNGNPKLNTSKLKPGDILLSEDVNRHVAIWLDDGVYQASWSSKGCSYSIFPRGPEPRPHNDLVRVYRYKNW